jgi:CheY-like chemotaxis protein
MIKHLSKQITIVMADDDPEDQLLAQRAMESARLLNPFICVDDGVELLDLLNNKPPFEDATEFPKPGLIILDLNMPRKNGQQALKEIKADPSLQNIPVVVLTTSKADEDVLRSYNLGASSYICKPVNFEKLVGIMKSLGNYWFSIVESPLGK